MPRESVLETSHGVWEVFRRRRLKTHGTLDYCALSINSLALCTACSCPLEFIDDSKIPIIKQHDEPEEPGIPGIICLPFAKLASRQGGTTAAEGGALWRIVSHRPAVDFFARGYGEMNS